MLCTCSVFFARNYFSLLLFSMYRMTRYKNVEVLLFRSTFFILILIYVHSLQSQAISLFATTQSFSFVKNETAPALPLEWLLARCITVRKIWLSRSMQSLNILPTYSTHSRISSSLMTRVTTLSPKRKKPATKTVTRSSSRHLIA